ncbi:MAG: hypothetical protein WC043_02000 [Pseudobdellovibrionaceae bacterium]
MDNITVGIRFFGAFRTFGKDVVLSLPLRSNILAVKQALIAKIGKDQELLVNDSVLANSVHILPEAYVLEENCCLSILPPVCGG